MITIEIGDMTVKTDKAHEAILLLQQIKNKQSVKQYLPEVKKTRTYYQRTGWTKEDFRILINNQNLDFKKLAPLLPHHTPSAVTAMMYRMRNNELRERSKKIYDSVVREKMF